jgi:flagellin
VDLTLGTYTTATSSTVDTLANAKTALTNVKAALVQLSKNRADIGANISVLGSYQEQLGVLQDNLSAANSRIKDVDVATESATYAKFNILVQAGTAMLAQANQVPQSVLKLLQ